MNWGRVALAVIYAAAVGAAAYFQNSAYVALWGLLGFVAVILIWEAVGPLVRSIMRKYRGQKELTGNVNELAEQLFPALSQRDAAHRRHVCMCLDLAVMGLMFGHHKKNSPVFPSTLSFAAYVYMMPRFVFDLDGREVGSLIPELSMVAAYDIETMPQQGRLAIELVFPIATINNIENRFGDIHRYYDGILCSYTGKRIVVASIDFEPSRRMTFQDGSFKDFHRLLTVTLATEPDTRAEIQKVIETFRRVKRTDSSFFNRLTEVWEPEEAQQNIMDKPRIRGPLWFQPHDGEGGHLRDGYLYFGDKHLTDGSPYWVPIKRLTHFLVSGMSGSGKSYFLHQVLEGVAYNEKHFDDVYLIDLKGGVELWKYNGQANGLFHVIYKYDEVLDMVEGLNALMDERLDSMRERGLRDWDGNKVLVVVDEFAELSFELPEDKEAKARKQKMLAGLSRLSSKARAAGIVLWAQLQKGTTDVMDSGFRNNLQSEVMFCQKTKLQAAMVFGAVDNLSVDPTRLQAGEFVMLDANTRELLYLKSRMIRGV
jgi:hypothetical protein